ncbi:hypothetical protein DFH06DRAFT_577885 [Mycena polygramma]|nr:hypothetical protein DFH06DRAFT_577885 [Mycena polygramma]
MPTHSLVHPIRLPLFDDAQPLPSALEDQLVVFAAHPLLLSVIQIQRGRASFATRRTSNPNLGCHVMRARSPTSLRRFFFFASRPAGTLPPPTLDRHPTTAQTFSARRSCVATAGFDCARSPAAGQASIATAPTHSHRWCPRGRYALSAAMLRRALVLVQTHSDVPRSTGARSARPLNVPAACGGRPRSIKVAALVLHSDTFLPRCARAVCARVDVRESWFPLAA